MLDREFIKEWKEIEQALGMAAMERVKSYVAKLLQRNEDLRESRDMWKERCRFKVKVIPSARNSP